MSTRICMTVTILLLLGLIVGTSSAWMPGVPVKNITLGEYIEEHDAVNRDARGKAHKSLYIQPFDERKIP